MVCGHVVFCLQLVCCDSQWLPPSGLKLTIAQLRIVNFSQPILRATTNNKPTANKGRRGHIPHGILFGEHILRFVVALNGPTPPRRLVRSQLNYVECQWSRPHRIIALAVLLLGHAMRHCTSSYNRPFTGIPLFTNKASPSGRSVITCTVRGMVDFTSYLDTRPV